MRSSGFTKLSRLTTTGLYSNNTTGLYPVLLLPSLLQMIAQIPPSLAGLVPGFTLSSSTGNSISALNQKLSDLRVSSNARSTRNTPTIGTPQASLYCKCSIPSVNNLVAVTEMDWWEGSWDGGGVLGRARLEGISSKNINLRMSVRSAAVLPSTKIFLKTLVKDCSSRVPDGANMYDLN